jgi:triacylglycerol lipase
VRSLPLIKRLGVGLVAAALSAAVVVTVSVPAQAKTPLPEGGVLEALVGYSVSPGAVAGANDWSCKPTSAHPNPVVLLPGTFFNIGANFVKASPRLANNGYCVFAMNYGFTAGSFDRVGGLASITTSAAQLDAFVARVRQATGAGKVDVIGHSQGGSVPMWWIKKMGGADKVAHYVGWAPSSHGTTLNGLASLANTLGLFGFVTGLSNIGQFPGVVDQAYSSEYTKQLWADGNTVPTGPKYTVIASTRDTVVTPYTSQALAGPNVTNIVLQDKCPSDFAGHVGLFNDGPTLQMTMNALADGPANFAPQCTDFGLQLN